jgi:hypothetical protein
VKLLLLLSAAAAVAPTADELNAYPRPNPIEEWFWALFGVAMAIVLVRTIARLRKGLPGADPINAASVPMPDPEAVLLLKLGQWRSSMFILITFTVLSMTVIWFDRIPYLFGSGEETFSFDYMAGPLGESMGIYAFAFAPVLAWHLADLIERPRVKSRLLAAFTSHALMTGVLVAFSLAWFLYATGWFTDIGPCGGIFLLLTEACWYTHPAIEFPSLLLFLATLPITLVKLAVALRSRLGPRS